ncbi:MAG: hypothetical protein QME94_15155 [Anaerolineae bacterium]|nr:hypothetical protein [Anaerolineae bacterium]
MCISCRDRCRGRAALSPALGRGLSFCLARRQPSAYPYYYYYYARGAGGLHRARGAT